MGKVFDCRYHKYIINHKMVTEDDYVAVIQSETPPKEDDLLIAASREIMVIDHVEHFEENLYKVAMKSFGMGVNEPKVPSYRHLKRSIFSQFKRMDRRK